MLTNFILLVIGLIVGVFLKEAKIGRIMKKNYIELDKLDKLLLEIKGKNSKESFIRLIEITKLHSIIEGRVQACKEFIGL